MNRNAPRLDLNALERKHANVSSAAVTVAAFSFTAAHLTASRVATITARTAGVMISFDGTDPTATVGHLVPAGGTVRLSGGSNIARLRLIREGSTDSTVTITLES